MDFQSYRRKILSFDHKITDIVYDDERAHKVLNYKASLNNSGLKATTISGNISHNGTQQYFVYTREGELKSFMRYDLMKKLLHDVVVRLKTDEKALPNDDDIILYENVRQQQAEIYENNIRLTGCVLQLYFRKNGLHKKHWNDYEAETQLYLLSAVCGFNYTLGYRFSTYFYRIALNNLRAFFDSNYKRMRRFKTNSLNRNKINNRFSDIIDPEPTALDITQASDDHLKALKSIGNLEIHEQRIIIASYYSNEVVAKKTCIQVCKLLGISAKQYKAYTRSAFNKLRNCDILQSLKKTGNLS